MKITRTRALERYMADLYSRRSQDEESDIAQGAAVDEFLKIIRYIDIFSGTKHGQVVTELYFCENNITNCTIDDIAERVFIMPRTLLYYRLRYASIMEEIFTDMHINV